MNTSTTSKTAGPESTRVDSTYLNVLIETLTPYLDYHYYPVGHRFTISANKQSDCYIIRQGAISMYRQPDDILVELIEAPTLRGIIPVHETSHSVHTLRMLVPTEIAIIDTEQLYKLLTELNLWQPFAMHLKLVASMAAEVLFKLTSPSVFDVVRLQLFELMNKSTELRESITAENYIRSKTRLSRSAIMRVLSDLKTGNYIVIENGILKGINHIPEKY